MHWREHGSEDWTLGRNVCDLIANFKHNEQEQDFVLFIFYMNVAYMEPVGPILLSVNMFVDSILLLYTCTYTCSTSKQTCRPYHIPSYLRASHSL